MGNTVKYVLYQSPTDVRVAMSVEYRKKQFLRMSPNELWTIVRDKVGLGRNDHEFERELLEGLFEAVETQPAIAVSLCPKLVASGEPRLIEIFGELLPFLWEVNESQAVSLINQARNAGSKARSKIDYMIGIYQDDVIHASPAFKAFLTNL